MNRLADQVNRHEQESLISRAVVIAETIAPSQAKQLTRLTHNGKSPSDQPLAQQLIATAVHFEQMCGVFTVVRHDDTFLFNQGRCQKGRPSPTPPGTLYQHPPPQLHAAFALGQTHVTPLYTDEFGTFITAFAPVIDPATGDVLLVVGADGNLPQWRKRVLRAQGITLGFTFFLVSLLTLAFIVIRRNYSSQTGSHRCQRGLETGLCVVIMLTLTTAISLRLGQSEIYARDTAFRATVQQHTSAVMQELCGIHSSLDNLACMFQASENVTPDEFSFYASRAIADFAIQGALWLPAIKPDDVARFEAEARATDRPGYQIRHSGATVDPSRSPQIHYPIRYIEAQTAPAEAFGIDLNSEPTTAHSLQRALSTGLTVATPPLPLAVVSNQPAGIYVYRPTFTHTQTGAVALAVCLDAVMRGSMNGIATIKPQSGLIAGLYLLSTNTGPLFLASSQGKEQDTAAPTDWAARDQQTLCIKQPIVAFGNTYGMLFRASPAWLAAHPLHQGVTAAATGLLLTTVLTIFFIVLNGHRISLERQVFASTAALQLEHDKVSNILSTAPVAMMLVDRDTRVLDANPRSEQLIDSQIIACRHQPCGVFLCCVHRHLHPQGCGYSPNCNDCVLRRSIQAVADGGAPVSDIALTTITQRGGKRITSHLKFSAAPMLFNGQRHVVVALHDVTEWYRTEQLYRTLFNAMNYGILLVERTCDVGTPNLIIRAANPAALMLSGRDAEHLLGLTIRQALPHVPEEFLTVLDQVLKTGQAAHYEYHREAADMYFESTMFRPLDGQVAVIFTDVTARKRAEFKAQAAAQETERLLRKAEAAQSDLLVAINDQQRADQAVIYERNLLYALMDNQPDRIFFKDADLRFTKVSREQARALGLSSPADAIGKTIADLVPGEAALKTMERERDILCTGKPLLAQVEKTTDSAGIMNWDSVSKAPIRDAHGAFIGIVGIARDITSEIELQQQLQQVTKMDAIGRLAGGVAHDFNNLLQAILGYTELLLAGVSEKDPQHADLGQIEKAAKRAARLTRQLLTFSRKQRIEPQALDLNQIINSTKKMLDRLMGDTIEIVLTLDPDLKPILADPSQIEQILLNLAVNAKDAMPQGGRLTFCTEMKTVDVVEAQQSPEAQPGRFSCLTVSDTGCGIHPDMQPHLFEPFFTTKGQGKGTGLGLSVIYGIVKQSGGWISVVSKIECGTSFKIFLPICEQPLAVQGGENATLADHSILSGLGKTILLVEDEPGVRSLAALVLQSAGYKVLSCENAQEAKAVSAMEHDTIHLLFSDVVLIGQNGIDLAFELRKRRPVLPVLLCSGYADDSVQWDFTHQEGFSFLPKPYPITKLLAAVRDALANQADNRKDAK